MRQWWLSLLLTIPLFAQTTLYEKGQSLYFEKGCNGCHGTHAEGVAAYPSLANRAQGFLTYKLKRFRDGISENQQQEMMIPFAKNLSDADIEALTTFLHQYHDSSTEKYQLEFQTWGDGGS